MVAILRAAVFHGGTGIIDRFILLNYRRIRLDVQLPPLLLKSLFTVTQTELIINNGDVIVVWRVHGSIK